MFIGGYSLPTPHSPLSTQDALAFLASLTDLERRHDYMYDKATFGLERMARLCKALGHPEQELAAIHVAGTNGKGSVCAFAEAILRACGLRTGLFTSPHLIDLRERVRIDGQPIAEEELTRAVGRLMAVFEGFPERDSLTFFEVYTAVALEVFARLRPVDVAIFEVGMGGRLDSTNVLRPRVSGITPIGLDHTRYLGTTIESIAAEKAGIVKPGVPVVSNAQGPAQEVVEEHCRRLGALLFTLGREIRWRRGAEGIEVAVGEVGSGEWGVGSVYRAPKLGLRGGFQAENAACAIALVSLFLGGGRWATLEQLPEEAVSRGLEAVSWPGRFQVLPGNPAVVLDGAMNPEAARALVEALEADFPGAPTVYVFGMSRDKDPHGVVEALLRRQTEAIVLTAADNPRAARPEFLQTRLPPSLGAEVEIEADPAAALARAREICPPNGVVCVTGSLYLVGEILIGSGEQ